MLQKLLLFVSLHTLACFAPFSDDSFSKPLTDENYEDFLKTNENVFVKFYKPK